MLEAVLSILGSIIIACLMFFVIKYRRMALYDERTGLLNCKEFERRLIKRMRYIKDHHDYVLFYFMVDLDKFKQLNDKKGHQEGDRVLEKISEGFMSSLRVVKPKIKFKNLRFDKDKICTRDLVGRYGGEEFCIAIVINKNTPYTEPLDIGQRLNTITKKAGCSASIGIAEFHSYMNVEVGTIVKLADCAMYCAKAMGGDATIYYKNSLTKNFKRRNNNE